MDRLYDEVKEALLTLWLLMIPSYRRRSVTVHSLARWSLVLGVFQVAGGSMTYIIGGLSYMGAFSDQVTSAMMEKADGPGRVDTGDALAVQWGGAIGFVSFLFTPLGALAVYNMFDGTIRFAGYWANEATGTVALYPGFALWDMVTGGARRARRRAQFGVTTPDRLRWHPRPGTDEWTLEIEASHDKDWRDLDAIRVGEQLFELVETDEVRQHGQLRIRYRMRPWPDNRTVFSVIAYQPPPGSPSPPRLPPVQMSP